MNRDQIAHEYTLKLLEQNRTQTINDIVVVAFDLADAMLKEANKRKEVGFPLDEEHK